MSERPSIIVAVRDHALNEAEELEQEASAMRSRAKENQARARMLRQLHAVVMQDQPEPVSEAER